MFSRRSFWTACLVILLAGFLSSPHVEAAPQSQRSYQLRVDVNLVNLMTTVVASSGEPAAGLTREDFEIYEDGVKQELTVFEPQTQLPLALGLMVDASLSTAKDLRFEQESAARFIAEVVQARDELAVYQFSDDVRRLADFSGDVDYLERAVRGVVPDAGTALYDAIVRGSRDLARREGRRVLILVTDGDDTTSENDFHAALRASQRAEVLLYAVVIRPIRSEAGRNVRGEHALIQLAEGTGGHAFFPDRVEELDRIFPMINRELRTQYLLGYYPQREASSANFRRLEVRVKQPNLLVRHRRGYYPHPERDENNE